MAGLAGFWNFFETCQNLPKPAIGYVCLGKSQSAFFASSSSGNQVLSAATVHLENGGQRYAARC